MATDDKRILGSKALLFAHIQGYMPELRYYSGHSDDFSTHIVVRSNTKWRFETDETWIHLENTDLVYGDSTLRFKYDEFTADTVMTVRYATIRIVSSHGHILNHITIGQAAEPSVVLFTSDDIGTPKPNMEVAHTAGSQSLYVFTSKPEQEWNILKYTGDGNNWYSVSPTSGTGTTPITITYDESPQSIPRLATVFVTTAEDVGDSLDEFTITQKEVPADEPEEDALVSIVTGGVGDWNVNMKWVKVKMNKMSASGICSSGGAQFYNQDTVRSVRTDGLVEVFGHQYAIMHYGKMYPAPTVDAENNPTTYVGRENNWTNKNYDKNTPNFNNWTFEVRNTGADIMSEQATVNKNETAFYSRYILENAASKPIQPAFYSSVPLVPTDATNYVLGHMEKYTGTGTAVVALHNVFDTSQPIEDQAQFKYDRYLAGLDENDEEIVQVFDGPFNPNNIPNAAPMPSNESEFPTETWNSHAFIKGCRVAENNYNMFSSSGVQRAAKKPTTVTVRVDVVAPPITLEIEHLDGRIEEKPMYAYTLISVGYDENVPEDAIIGLQTYTERKGVINKKETTLEFNVEFQDQHSYAEGEFTPEGVHFRTVINMVYRPSIELIMGILKITRAVIKIVALFFGHWAGKLVPGDWVTDKWVRIFRIIVFIVNMSMAVVATIALSLGKKDGSLLVLLNAAAWAVMTMTVSLERFSHWAYYKPKKWFTNLFNIPGHKTQLDNRFLGTAIALAAGSALTSMGYAIGIYLDSTSLSGYGSGVLFSFTVKEAQQDG